MNKKTLFNDGWKFAKSRLDAESAEGLVFEPVDLPHDWLIYNTLNLYENSIGWYRKTFQYSKAEDQVLLYFDGVYMDSALYVNGQWIGEWKYGYSSFEHDITGALVEGENEILLKVIHQSPNSRWYSGAGIYRNVWLKRRDKNHIVTDGVYISTRQNETGWEVEVETEISVFDDLEITHTLMYKEQTVAEAKGKVSASNDSRAVNTQTLSVEQPFLWSTDEPHLYQLITQVRHQDKRMETQVHHVGFRSIMLDSESGFRLNGQRMKLNGVCEHHDLGALGAAFNKTALKRRFGLLKEMGVNAIRTAHNMPAKELMNLADEMGFLVVTEAFDMWERSKTPYDYARFFKEWAPTDVKSWVRRDRNHPSLMMWSIGNEIYDTHADERGQEITKMLSDLVQEHDPKRNGAVTIGSNYMPWENAQKCADLVEVAGYNYGEKYYNQHHQEHPDWIIYGSETASVVQSRGIYHFPYNTSILADDDEQCSSLGNSSTSWGAKSAEACILAERNTPFSPGQFLWTGFDYIGEPTPYHTKNSYFGQLDTATFKKDSYYVYQAAWTDYKKSPMVHIFPYWDFSEGQLIDVRVCSNAPKIELQLNGTTVGTYEIDHENGTQLSGWWQIPYQEGELKAIAYDENDEIIATDVKSSFKDAHQIRLNPDKNELMADGQDLIFVGISMEDEAGHPVENANNRVQVEVTGAGRLLGLDNGDSTDYDHYKGKSRRLFSGKLMAIIGSTLEPGNIKVEVSSQGMESQTATFASHPIKKEEVVKGISAMTKNQEREVVMGSLDEIPLRKIEILSPSGQILDAGRRILDAEARLYPENASYQDVEWSVVTAGGIPSNTAVIEASGLSAKIKALGDGEFRVRCTSSNGTEKTKLISELEFSATGLGTAYKDPYKFISAGLYDYHRGEVTSGNERGVATSRDGETQVGFRDIDFGPHGSDTIVLPIFALSSEPYALQIWEGMPEEEGSELLADVIYQKESKWNVYQEETYHLSKKLRGITSLCFVLRQKVHIKGFSFEKTSRAYEQLFPNDCDSIYGDTFTKGETRITGIGNNVSLVFEEMDFTGEGAKRLVINGQSPIDKNTIHIRFENAKGESQQMVEFSNSNEYEERVFELEKVTGMQKVTFVFLPGSNFDFGWFRFQQ
ncbi:glycoside hydrolase family 2 TIM barrel-domain containing protein [Fictibacillus fluitans]|uniref:Glycoside hydrolase family 2 TIM barrel-domain containing protein n=1 Tax=Fictibacillus fluitans TaxID=3058422 RepID=A0ABT8HWB7_9BACL|nr:glycoside hydrolase family 2 TIM barrel-domain containing protein [Fictibacillus sp. NE201]MDN4525074.1 glycoside hydrolase family 2 TIM barrel-domain containing protein [Fictibacillus sp. NE201]